MLRAFDFPTAMALPMASATKPAGIATGLRRLSDAFQRPLIAYIRTDGYIAPKDLAALIADGAVCAVKYAVERKDPADDKYLAAIVEAAGAERIVSGIGERPAIVHLTRFGLGAFTSGSVCIAPHMSMAVLRALKAGDVARRRCNPRKVPRLRGRARRSVRRSSSSTTASVLPASPTPARSSPTSPTSTRTASPSSPWRPRLFSRRMPATRGKQRPEASIMAYLPAPDRYDRMTYRRSGRSGLDLPAISLGLWQNFGEKTPPGQSREICLAAFDSGITHFDLANNYGPPPGAAEEFFGEHPAHRLSRPSRRADRLDQGRLSHVGQALTANGAAANTSSPASTRA